mgnify:CR=1 FL=1
MKVHFVSVGFKIFFKEVTYPQTLIEGNILLSLVIFTIQNFFLGLYQCKKLLWVLSLFDSLMALLFSLLFIICESLTSYYIEDESSDWKL